MRNFKQITKLSLVECKNYIEKNDSESKYYHLISQRLTLLTEKEKGMEDKLFGICKTIEDCKHYLELFPCGKHSEEALLLIEELQWKKLSKSAAGCRKYLKEYNNGKYKEEASKIIKVAKIKKTIWASISIVLLLMVSYLGYKPATYIHIINDFDLDPTKEVSMYGCTFENTIETDADRDNISVSTSESWIEVSYAGLVKINRTYLICIL